MIPFDCQFYLSVDCIVDDLHAGFIQCFFVRSLAQSEEILYCTPSIYRNQNDTHTHTRNKRLSKEFNELKQIKNKPFSICLWIYMHAQCAIRIKHCVCVCLFRLICALFAKISSHTHTHTIEIVKFRIRFLFVIYSLLSHARTQIYSNIFSFHFIFYH